MKRRVLVGLGVFLGVMCIFYFLFYLPKVEYKKILNTRISQEERRLVQLARRFQELEELRKDNRKMLQNLSSLEEKITGTQSSFLHEFGKTGGVYGIEYVNIIPLSSVQEEHYTRTPVKIDLYGRYHNLGMLLSDIARREGLGSFTVDSVLLRTSLKEKYTIEANLVLSLYKYKSRISSTGGSDTFSLETISSENPDRRIR
ncbi:type 4a pilus biogenesis protein PilO [Candidatus Aerophobetes bacterium]|nr:type 4a pilus biogenesis protein PilO [Candidatus Aerophobetes bacterium]